MKRYQTIVWGFLFMILLFSTGENAFAAERMVEFEYNKFFCRMYEKIPQGTRGMTILGYTGNEEVVEIPEMIEGVPVTIMDDLVFEHPKKIKKLILPKYMRNHFGDAPFANLENLESIEVAEGNEELFSEEGILFAWEKSGKEMQKVMVCYPRNKAGAYYEVPENVIGGSFASTNHLKKVVTNGKMVGDFYNSSVEEVVIKDGPTSLEMNFWKCKNLKKVVLSKDITWIGEDTFYGCTSLMEITLPEGLRYIGDGAFNGCTSLKELVVPSTVHTLKWTALSDCPAKIITSPYLIKNRRGGYSAKIEIEGSSKKYYASYVTKLKAQKKEITLKKNKRKKLNLTVYVNRQKKGILKTQSILKYTSSDPKIVKVTKKGKIKALKKGMAIIRIAMRTRSIVDPFEVSCEVKVKVK